MKKICLFLIIMLTVSTFAQSVRTKRMIDIPTAFSMKQAEIEMGGRLFADDGMSGEVNIGIFDEFYIGVSWGGTEIIGRNKPVWNGHPGVRLHYRIVPEDFYYPNIAIGFDSQGQGVWQDPRYEIKSKGFYFVLSKNYFVSGGQLGTLGIHLGTNYCVTEKPISGDDNLNFFFGIDKSLVQNLSLLAEYDFAFNDDAEDAPTRGNGYLNIGFRWSFNNELHLEFDVKDVLRNRKAGPNGERLNPSRELRIIYNTAFFAKR
ncbi:MAG: YjbH domain-containing protein [Candidatus Delongbacteria bacterium]|nr:YjbH domain-containing protein [Candidatus Delongbacteria bacterium]